MDRVRFGIVGLGRGAKVARWFPNTEGAELVCVCDLQEEKAKSIAEELDCDWTLDYDEMVGRDDIEVVGVYTSSGTHCDLAVKAMKTGKHAFVTKPMDIRVDKCDAAIDVAKKANVTLAVDFPHRYLDLNRRIKIALEKRRLGNLILGDLRVKWYRTQDYYNGGYPRGWRKRRVTEGGSAANQAVHYIDLLQWFMGPVETVYSRTGHFAHEIETEDLSLAMLTFVDGALGSITTTTTQYPSLGTTIEITGDNGSIVWTRPQDRPTSATFRIKDHPEASLDEFELEPDRPKNIIEEMFSAVREGKPVLVDGYEGRKAVVIFNAMYESDRIGKIVQLI